MRLLKEDICAFCKKKKQSFTYWPEYRKGYNMLLCDDCSEEHLTAEGHKERTGLTSYKEKGK